jgi:uncharacterized membrane protein
MPTVDNYKVATGGEVLFLIWPTPQMATGNLADTLIRRSNAMTRQILPSEDVNNDKKESEQDFFRFHLPHSHLLPVFGSDWFALKAEAFARFFGTPVFLIAQTVVVAIWILTNALGFFTFDIYPFILLNLAFSTQAAYAAPLILLAQTRQADRDKAHALADAQHREDLHRASEERQELAEHQTALLVDMVRQNTLLTETIKSLTERVEVLTVEVHKTVVAMKTA